MTAKGRGESRRLSVRGHQPVKMWKEHTLHSLSCTSNIRLLEVWIAFPRIYFFLSWNRSGFVTQQLNAKRCAGSLEIHLCIASGSLTLDDGKQSVLWITVIIIVASNRCTLISHSRTIEHCIFYVDRWPLVVGCYYAPSAVNVRQQTRAGKTDLWFCSHISTKLLWILQ